MPTITEPLLRLEDLLRSPEPNVVIIEAAKEPGAAVLNGAIRVTLANFGGVEGPETGRLPLPDHAAFAEWLGSHGIAPGTPVVIIRAESGDLAVAARTWVTLRWAGVRRVRVVSDAVVGDLAEQAFPTRPVAATLPEPFVVDETVTVRAADVERRDPAVLLIDARPAEAFGDATQHIPGAINVPTALLGDRGTLLPADRIREVYAERIEGGIEGRQVLAYCGSGVAASVQALALASIGVEAPVYIGSWSEWSKRRPTLVQ